MKVSLYQLFSSLYQILLATPTVSTDHLHFSIQFVSKLKLSDFDI